MNTIPTIRKSVKQNSLEKSCHPNVASYVTMQ